MQPLAARVVVADSGPLIALGRLDELSLLAHIFAQVQVPRAVLAECLARPELPDAIRIQKAVASGLLLPCDARTVDVAGLGPGESAAIGYAIDTGATLLADDLAARKYAHAQGIVVIGTLGVLVFAKHKGLVHAVRPLVEQLRATGQRLSHSAVAQALVAAGE